MRAALYARYSSDNQRAESITAQIRCSKEYCEVKNALPAIIDKELFYQVQSMLRKNTGGKNKATVVYALSGKVFFPAAVL